MTTPWVAYRKPLSNPRLRLFCFPYAGGGARMFVSWIDQFGPDVEVCPVQPPGRESRFHEPCLRRVADAADQVAEALRPHLDTPFVFFGHSLGAIVAYEAALRLEPQGLTPQRFFASGRRAPSVAFHSELTHTLSDEEFSRRLRDLNGTPPAVLAHKELMTMMRPMIRADFELDETYDSNGVPKRMSCPLSAFGGLGDPEVPLKNLEAWREATSGPFETQMFEGDHFFLHSRRDQLIAALRARLDQE